MMIIIVAAGVCVYFTFSGNKKAVQENSYDSKQSLKEDENSVDVDEVKVIKSITSYNEDGIIQLCKEYDSEGNCTKLINYDSEGNSVHFFEWEYDTEGNVIKCTSCEPNGDNRQETEYEYEYDAKGNVVEGTGYSYGYVSEKQEYDDRGNIIKVTYYDIEAEAEGIDSFNGYNEIIYDDSNNEIKSTWYDSEGDIDSYDEYEYNTKGDRTKIIYYTDGKVVSETEFEYEYEYDGEGNIIKKLSNAGWEEYEYY
jgi:YD repeat-containing protein